MDRQAAALGLALAGCIFTVAAYGVSPAPDGGYAGNNTAEGTSALFNLTSGIDNTGLGFQALFHETTGNYNTATGYRVLFSNTTGSQNTASGINALSTNTTGNFNTATGVNTLYRNTTGGYNTASGVQALFSNTIGNDNTVTGFQALQSNTTGSFNSFFGMSAGQQNTTESDNTFIGHFAGAANGANDINNTASNNTFVGYAAGLSNSVAGFNTFVGAYSGNQNTTAFGNAFFGSRSGENNATGNRNTFLGTLTGQNNLTQHDNTFVGSSAGLLTGANDSGGNANFNTFVGSQAGQNNELGTSNTLIGANSDVGANNLTNASALGSRALVSSNNSLVLGSISGLNSATSDTNVGIGTASPAFKLHIAGHNTHDWPIIKLQNVDAGGHSYWLYAGAGGNAADFGIYDETVNAYRVYINGSNGNVGINIVPSERLDVLGDIRVGAAFGCVKDRLNNVIAGSCGSDARLKRDITPFPKLLDQLVQLQPVHFYWRTEEFPERHFGTSQSFGLVAQDVEKVLPELVGEDEQGYKVVHYQKLPLLMLQAIKDLKAENETLRIRILDSERQRTAQQIAARKQQTMLDALRKLVCSDHPDANICNKEITR